MMYISMMWKSPYLFSIFPLVSSPAPPFSLDKSPSRQESGPISRNRTKHTKTTLRERAHYQYT